MLQTFILKYSIRRLLSRILKERTVDYIIAEQYIYFIKPHIFLKLASYDARFHTRYKHLSLLHKSNAR